MSSLPASWETAPLRELCLPVNKMDPADTGRSTVRYIDISGVDGRRHALTEVADIAAAGAPSRCRQVVRTGDTVFSTVRPYLEKIALVDPSLDNEFASTGFSVLRPGQRLEPKYLYYFAVSRTMLDQVLPLQKGVSYPAVLDREVRTAVVPVPPLGEQRRIVAILEDHLSRLDAADGVVTCAVRRLEALRAAVLREAFGRSAATIRPLLEVAAIANGQTPKGLVENLTAHRTDGSVPFFKVGDMNAADGRWMDEARFFASEQVVARLGLHIRPSGTVLIPKRGGAIATNKKRVLREPAAYDLNTMGLVPSPELESSYLWHWLQTVDLGRIADGSNVPQINAAQIREMSLPVPDKETQRLICDELDAIDDQAARLALEISAARQRVGRLRSALLTAAFSGKLTVKERAGV